ncbi:serine hydrolase [Sphingomonas sp. CFBP 13720]|uniref:serine hydrolase n=1 Tax=Sphingomonas sp. CFBP 13720 TaxID=2775302 RepID=UPI00177BC81C|nr:serine hydrolase [Sphingomonas sp. CFBP 13720]MBD8677344.1 serine hydrolase [Sphingomonas sp. CFBP 13720]
MKSLLAFAVLTATPVMAQTAPPAPQPQPTRTAPVASPELQQRVREVVTLLGGSGDYDATFSTGFRTALLKATFDGMTAQIVAQLGKPTGVESITADGPWAARLKIGFEHGILDAQIAIDSSAPHPVTMLRATGSEPRAAAETTIDAIVATLATLPGRTNFTLARLGAGAPVRIAGRESATPLAIGSAFKLVILSELVRSIAAGERKWTDTVTLNGRPLPSGFYTQAAKGTAVPIRDLAERMISVSDNSATDILLFHLGRQKVEAMLPVVGMTDGARRNVPFLGTLEMFKLKGIDQGALGTRFLATPPGARRAFLDGPVAAAPIAAIPATLFQDGKPIHIADIEWFASADDLVRTMDWLRRAGDGPGGTELRAILSKNPGLPAPAAKWDYAGYKGGSEPGVLNMTFVLRAKDSQWYALSAGWNDPDRSVDTLRFTGLMTRTLELAAPR